VVCVEDKVVEELPEGLHEGKNKVTGEDGRIVRVLVKRYKVHKLKVKSNKNQGVAYPSYLKWNGVDGNGDVVFSGWRLKFYKRT